MRITYDHAHLNFFAYNMIREELAVVKQNGAWKPQRKRGWSGLFTLQMGQTFSFADLINLFFYCSELIRVQFYFIFIFLFDPSWSESIRVDPTQTGGPSWSGPTFVPASLIMEIWCILSIILITQMHQLKILLEDSPSSQKLCDYYLLLFSKAWVFLTL